MMTEFKIGDKVRILDASKIKFSSKKGIVTNGIYEVDYVYTDGTPEIKTPSGGPLGFYLEEMQFVEVVTEKPTKKQRIEALETQVSDLTQTVEKQAKQIAELQSVFAKLREALS